MSDVITDSSIHKIPILAPVCRDSLLKRKPGAGNRIRLRDARQLYLLVAECRAAGIDGLVWRRHLTWRLRSMFEADLVAFIDLPAAIDAKPTGAPREPVSIVENGSLDGFRTSPSEFLCDSYREIAHLYKCAQHWRSARVMTLQEAMCVAAKHDNNLGQRARQVTGLGNCLLSVNPGPSGTIQLLCLYQRPDMQLFSRRVVHLLRALWVDLRLLQPDELVGIENSVFVKYPKRMLQVLSCLLAGNTAKETAALLNISIHTVQEHTKRLYKRTDTSNRAELAEFFHNVAPLLIETPLHEYPDHSQSQNGTIRDHRL